MQNLCFNDLYCYLATKKTFQLKIICLKFVEFYTLNNFEPQNIMRIEQNFKKKYLFVTQKNTEDKSISFTKQERKRYVIELLFSELS